MKSNRLFAAPIFLSLLVGAGCGGSPAATPASPSIAAPEVTAAFALRANLQAAVDAPDRSSEDRYLDESRHPVDVFTFFGIAPGQRVAELFAGGGYTSELLARMVGPEGQVFGQNSTEILERFARVPWDLRVAKPVNQNIVSVERPFEDPLPPEATNLDAVISILVYHDTVWIGTDRARMNQAVFAALRPGGVYGIVDHSAAPGTGVSDAETFHRIDEATLTAEVLAAGFVLDGSSDVMRNPADTRDWNDSPRAAGDKRGKSDRFILRFVKPAN